MKKIQAEIKMGHGKAIEWFKGKRIVFYPSGFMVYEYESQLYSGPFASVVAAKGEILDGEL